MFAARARSGSGAALTLCKLEGSARAGGNGVGRSPSAHAPTHPSGRGPRRAPAPPRHRRLLVAPARLFDAKTEDVAGLAHVASEPDGRRWGRGRPSDRSASLLGRRVSALARERTRAREELPVEAVRGLAAQHERHLAHCRQSASARGRETVLIASLPRHPSRRRHGSGGNGEEERTEVERRGVGYVERPLGRNTASDPIVRRRGRSSREGTGVEDDDVERDDGRAFELAQTVPEACGADWEGKGHDHGRHCRGGGVGQVDRRYGRVQRVRDGAGLRRPRGSEALDGADGPSAGLGMVLLRFRVSVPSFSYSRDRG